MVLGSSVIMIPIFPMRKLRLGEVKLNCPWLQISKCWTHDWMTLTIQAELVTLSPSSSFNMD